MVLFLYYFIADSALAKAISEGTEAIMALVEAGEVPELQEVLKRQREGGNDSDEENLELRPEEHESYDGGDDEQRYYDEVRNLCETVCNIIYREIKIASVSNLKKCNFSYTELACCTCSITVQCYCL